MVELNKYTNIRIRAKSLLEFDFVVDITNEIESDYYSFINAIEKLVQDKVESHIRQANYDINVTFLKPEGG